MATGLTNPRDMIFDTSGHLLVSSASRGSYDTVLNISKVVQQGAGVQALTLKDNGGKCVTIEW